MPGRHEARPMDRAHWRCRVARSRLKGHSMRSLILAAGRFDADMKTEIAADREPHLDVFEIANVLGADVLDFLAVDRSSDPLVRSVARVAGNSAAVAVLGFKQRHR